MRPSNARYAGVLGWVLGSYAAFRRAASLVLAGMSVTNKIAANLPWSLAA